ncbi:hypothetical protein CANARDRAFT_217037 [[Candida] arabinofermentans NRRL YB-2248]|uniref:Large ribosomal subunit protein mL53 n=1 Tax=[Candida] arabinofermentans NRRL YB-2248 TaxID=983967 RepID=A0A1E4T5Z5_9ASCO|nr:hypothetical protein CANARDRAFT_217037 [[Candida] arabinofermentans NRRL YB-2248]
MITKYFTKVVVKFNPFGPEAKSARIFLSQIPPSLRGICAIDFELLNSQSTKKPIVQVTFKDKTTMEGDPVNMNIADFANMFDRHSKKLAFQDEISK